MINILSALIYAWCLYTAFYDSSAYADYMGTTAEPESDDSPDADAGDSDEAEAEENSDEAD